MTESAKLKVSVAKVSSNLRTLMYFVRQLGLIRFTVDIKPD